MPYDVSRQPLTLQSGDILPSVTSHYEVYGQLNATKSNAVLLCHTLTANAVVAGPDGWWDYYVGSKKSINTDDYCVISITVLGSCKGSTCPDSYAFPVITIQDMVAAQARVIDALGIDKLVAVIGGSMGGMQALLWAIMYPERVGVCVPIATTSRLSPQALAFNAIGRQAIINHHDKGLILARMLGHTTYLSNKKLGDRFGRKLQNQPAYRYAIQPEFQIESYLIHQGDKFKDQFDAYSYYYLSKAISYFDLDSTYGSLNQALSATRATFFLIAIATDWLYPPQDSKHIVKALIQLKKPVQYATLHSLDGHDGFLLPNKQLRESLTHLPMTLFYDDSLSVIQPGDTVLDLGCGQGQLMQYLLARKSILIYGIDNDPDNILACLSQNLTVIEHDINMGLDLFDDQSFDVVIFSETLQEIVKPALIIKEIVRIGKQCVISFPNFSFIMNRIQLILGRAPQNNLLPYAWFESPNIRFLSVYDFEQFCKIHAIYIHKTLRLYDTPWLAAVLPHWSRNLLAPKGRFVISAVPPDTPDTRQVLAYYIEASRPKTLPASIAPVILATALAATTQPVSALTVILATLTVVIIQISTNFSNDYYDAIRGGDTHRVVGPRRLTQAGLIPATQMHDAMRVSLTVGCLTAIPLILQVPYSLIAVILGCLASYTYTGGSWPLAYHKLGEVLVFTTLGPVATLWVYYLHTQSLSLDSLIISLVPGCLSACVLLINNLRDHETDAQAGKITSVVRFGDRMGRLGFYVFLAVGLCIPAVLVIRGYSQALYYAYLILPLALYPCYCILTPPGRQYNRALAQMALFLLLFSGIMAFLLA